MRILTFDISLKDSIDFFNSKNLLFISIDSKFNLISENFENQKIWEIVKCFLELKYKIIIHTCISQFDKNTFDSSLISISLSM